ncbi:MAG: 16S rRNA (adenine(1518)-N(6)/adenine(1519)-N(6))-dimethyltransferase RsmA [Pantoea sp. Brub]|nr:16S rRNA (adenine(1518)-N(6)/adenine(1519)-N(6))-dimethyltransferase RsmA [Pantoea sp. Brub]
MNNYNNSKYYAKKHFGQNFLNNINIIDSIVASINPKFHDHLVEIGPGLGALTYPIIQNINKLIVIEIDHELISFLKGNQNLNSKLTIYQQDVMTFDFNQLVKDNKQPLRIFGNLPYNISTMLIFYLLNYINLIKDMHFMFQKEVANRMIVGPGNKNYGHLSIMAQFYFKITPLLEVPYYYFTPKPKVDSVLLRLIPFNQLTSPYKLKNVKLLDLITKMAFSQRRKKISNSLKQLINYNTFNQLSIDPNLRAENITILQYCNLVNSLTNNNNLIITS